MREPSKSLILCVHAHQPVGNFDAVIADAYEKSYRPFFETLERHPGVAAAAHFSGCLLDWIEANRREFPRLIRKLVERGQLEVLGGAYYEPIYGAIPRRDLEGQIEMASVRSEKLFGRRPEGAWLTERVWDPDLVKPLANAGIRYTVLDDHHFERAGKKGPITGYYETREGRDKLDLFASMKQLRYLMPFRRPEDTLEFLHAEKKAGPADVFTFGDDCEKFGMWPGTHEWVYGQKWLDKLLTLVERDRDVKTHTFSSFRKAHPARGRMQIGHASYSEMMDWCGGSFYNFFDKYPESRYMRDRMWSVSRQLEKATAGNGHGPRAVEAREALYRAQCNCAYWHGVFGGLYLHHLRSAVFENLIQAESYAAEKPASRWPWKRQSAAVTAERLESGPRWKVRQKDLVSFWNASYGAALEELDYIPKGVNLICTLQRQKESYHGLLVKKTGSLAAMPSSIHAMLGMKEEHLELHLHYDASRRLSFLDRFFDSEIGPEAFRKSEYRDTGDFAAAEYKARRVSERGANGASFEREGTIRAAAGRRRLRLSKTVLCDGDGRLRVRYRLENAGHEALRATFGVEFNFSIGEESAKDGLYRANVREWTLRDSWRGLRIKLSWDADGSFLAAPIETVSESESGLGRTYQQLASLVQLPLSLERGQAKEFTFELGVE